jgi:PAS domain S-box-containing protein
MSNSRILIVEDEGIIAKDIQSTLNRLGYSVIGIASSGEEAIKKAMEIHPDIVLMDIVLEGAMDGVEAAGYIHDHFDIPVVYLTAYSDDTTLQRAKITEPFGYILKPFHEKELYTTIEMALYKHTMQRKLKESEQWLATTLKSIGDAVIATDTGKLITFMNPVAEALTGWKQEEAIGKPLKNVFKVINGKTGKQADDPVAKVLREGVIVGLANHTVLIAKDGTKRSVDDSGAPIIDDKGKIIGVVLVFRDITERKITLMGLAIVEKPVGGFQMDYFDTIRIQSFSNFLEIRSRININLV